MAVHTLPDSVHLQDRSCAIIIGVSVGRKSIDSVGLAAEMTSHVPSCKIVDQNDPNASRGDGETLFQPNARIISIHCTLHPPYEDRRGNNNPITFYVWCISILICVDLRRRVPSGCITIALLQHYIVCYACSTVRSYTRFASTNHDIVLPPRFVWKKRYLTRPLKVA